MLALAFMFKRNPAILARLALFSVKHFDGLRNDFILRENIKMISQHILNHVSVRVLALLKMLNTAFK